MEWNISAVLVQVALAVAMLMGLLYSYITRHYGYWKKKGIPYLEPKFPFGNVEDLIFTRTDIGRVYERFYNEFKDHKYGGVFQIHKSTLILSDLDMVKQVLTKDFAYFTDRDLVPKSPNEFLMNHLFAMDGKEWKDMRTKLTPTYSSGKMKLMYTLIEKCSEQLKQHLEPLAKKEAIIDVKEVMSHFTIDIIATCAFGLEVNTLADSNTDFYEISQLIFKQSSFTFIKRFFMLTFPWLANFLQLSLIDARVKDFILNLVDTTVKYREKNNINRNDFLDLLIKIKNNHSLDDTTNVKTNDCTRGSLTLKEMAAQSFVFFIAGFETAASTTTFVLYNLACNPDVQEKLRREVDEVMENHGGQITYQAIQEMKYMEQVVNETLRMYASVPFLVHKCVEPYKIPDTNITIDKNVNIIVPSYAIHHDPDIYPEPFKFDPERFSEENIRTRHNYSFLAFGEGPRMCIGMRFGKMQVKAGLSTIIANFEISTTEDTPVPVEISPKGALTTPVNPIKLRITKRSY